MSQLACWTIRDLTLALVGIYTLGVLVGLVLPRAGRWVWFPHRRGRAP